MGRRLGVLVRRHAACSSHGDVEPDRYDFAHHGLCRNGILKSADFDSKIEMLLVAPDYHGRVRVARWLRTQSTTLGARWVDVNEIKWASRGVLGAHKI
jgi:hypothetical protein